MIIDCFGQQANLRGNHGIASLESWGEGAGDDRPGGGGGSHNFGFAFIYVSPHERGCLEAINSNISQGGKKHRLSIQRGTLNSAEDQRPKNSADQHLLGARLTVRLDGLLDKFGTRPPGLTNSALAELGCLLNFTFLPHWLVHNDSNWKSEHQVILPAWSLPLPFIPVTWNWRNLWLDPLEPQAPRP